MWHDTFICVTRLTPTYDTTSRVSTAMVVSRSTQSCVWHYTFISVTRPMHYVQYDCAWEELWCWWYGGNMYTCDSYVWHDPCITYSATARGKYCGVGGVKETCIHVTCPTHVCDTTYVYVWWWGAGRNLLFTYAATTTHSWLASSSEKSGFFSSADPEWIWKYNNCLAASATTSNFWLTEWKFSTRMNVYAPSNWMRTQSATTTHSLVTSYTYIDMYIYIYTYM